MDRPTHPVARLTPAIVASLAALVSAVSLAAPATFATSALADAPANDEYVLQLPGVRQSPSDSPGESATSSRTPRTNGPRQGVVGETEPPSSGLDSLGSALGSVPGALLAGLAVLVAIALCARLAHVGGRRTAHEAR